MAFENLVDFQHLALYDDKIKGYITGLLQGYVLAQDGKGLSQNDFTTALMDKLKGIEDGAQKNVQADWNADTGDAAILHKPTIPDVSDKLDKTGDGSDITVSGNVATNRANITTGSSLSAIIGQLMKWYSDLSASAWSGEYGDLENRPTIPSDNKDLANGAGYQTAENVKSIVEGYKYQTAADVAAAITAALKGEFVQVDKLPEAGETGKIYLVPNGGAEQNVKDEFIWLEASKSYERFGSTDIDLSGYLKTEDVTLATNDDINSLFTA